MKHYRLNLRRDDYQKYLIDYINNTLRYSITSQILSALRKTSLKTLSLIINNAWNSDRHSPTALHAEHRPINPFSPIVDHIAVHIHLIYNVAPPVCNKQVIKTILT